MSVSRTSHMQITHSDPPSSVSSSELGCVREIEDFVSQRVTLNKEGCFCLSEGLEEIII